MKKLIAFTLILTALSLISCKKKNNAAAPATTTTETASAPINVQYRVTAASGNFNVEHVYLDGDVVKTKVVLVKKTNYTFSFGWTTNQNLKIEASNESPSGKEVLVEIYVNGVLFKSGLANTPGGVAVAEGVYK